MSTGPGPSHVPLVVDRNGELHDAHTIESAPASLVTPLRCAECGAALEAVRAHPRRDGATIVHVAAHYRLAPGATHAQTCPWRTQQPTSTPDARPVARARPGLQVYSLVVPGRRTPSPVWRQRAFRPPKRPAINNAAQVVDLLGRVGDPSNELRLDYRGRPVSWHNFLFTCADTARLAQHLRRREPPHPIAVVGRPGERQVARSGDSHYCVLYDAQAGTGSHLGDPRVLLRSAHRQLLNADNVASPVVALGWWQLRRPRTAADSDAIVLWLNSRWQIGACPDEILVQPGLNVTTE